MISLHHSAMAAVIAIGLPAGAFAGIATDSFDTGTYPATGSGNWIGDWQTDSPDASITDALMNTSALTGGSGNYLNAVVTADNSSSNNIGAVARQLDDDGTGINTISFLFRVDELPDNWGNGSDNATSRNNRFQIFSADILAAGTGSQAGWIIFGADSAFGLNNEWGFHDGGKNGNFNTSFIPSGISINVGDTYAFTVTDDRDNSEYQVTVDNLDDAAPGYTSGVLGYRANSVSADPYLHFASSLRGVSGDTTGFSLEDVNVIPEPASLALIGLGGLVMIRRR